MTNDIEQQKPSHPSTTFDQHREHLMVPWTDPSLLPRPKTTYGSQEGNDADQLDIYLAQLERAEQFIDDLKKKIAPLLDKGIDECHRALAELHGIAPTQEFTESPAPETN